MLSARSGEPMTKKVKFTEFDMLVRQVLRNAVARAAYHEAHLRRNVFEGIENMLKNKGASRSYLLERLRRSYEVDKIQRSCVHEENRGYPLTTSTIVAVADCLGYDVEITFKKRKPDKNLPRPRKQTKVRMSPGLPAKEFFRRIQRGER